MDSKQLWRNICAELARRGAKDEEVALAAGISRRTLERRKREPGTLTTGELTGILRHFQIPFSEIVRAK